MIREAINQSYSRVPNKRNDGMLWVSDLGGHPVKALRRILENHREEFDIATHDKMSAGTALEADTIQRFISVNGNCITQFPLYDSMWSGYADLVYQHGTQTPYIIEHKAMSSYVFKSAPEKLVKSTHVCQLWMYGRLYEQIYGVHPVLSLYCRGWGEFAEVTVEQNDDLTIHLFGQVNEKQIDFNTSYRPLFLLMEMEELFLTGRVPSARDVPEDPTSWTYAEDSSARLNSEYSRWLEKTL